jgi:thiol-disulfide isomerase/thioredoxin
MFYYLNLHNKKAVNDVLDSSENVVILYYSDMCGHCIQLKPAWNKLCNSIKNKKDITIVNVEANNFEHLPEKYKKNIEGYPTIIKYSRGKKSEYKGNREMADMKKFITPVVKPAVKPVVKPKVMPVVKPKVMPKVMPKVRSAKGVKK